MAVIDQGHRRAGRSGGVQRLGGWIMLLANVGQARARGRHWWVSPPAPDFTHDLIEPEADARPTGAWSSMMASVFAPSAYGEPAPHHPPPARRRRAAIWCCRRRWAIRCRSTCCTASSIPTYLGRRPCAWPPAWRAPAVTVELITDGDHRLSREEDLRRIGRWHSIECWRRRRDPCLSGSARSVLGCCAATWPAGCCWQ